MNLKEKISALTHKYFPENETARNALANDLQELATWSEPELDSTLISPFAPGAKLLANGAKARQRGDSEDRGLPFLLALRDAGIPATDFDCIITNGMGKLLHGFELTRPNERVYSINYLKEIDDRRNDKSRGNYNDPLIAQISA